MADEKDKKDTPETQPATPTPPQAAAQPWIAAPEDVDESEEVTAAHQAMIKAEQEFAQVQLKAQENLTAAREKLTTARAKAAGVDIEGGTFPGYWHKVWGGHDCLQCGYCSWDVITSSLYDYVARMNEHLAAAHPNWQQLPAIFDKSGNFVEGGVQ